MNKGAKIKSFSVNYFLNIYFKSRTKHRKIYTVDSILRLLQPTYSSTVGFFFPTELLSLILQLKVPYRNIFFFYYHCCHFYFITF